jgi:hypothetical protein
MQNARNPQPRFSAVDGCKRSAVADQLPAGLTAPARALGFQRVGRGAQTERVFTQWHKDAWQLPDSPIRQEQGHFLFATTTAASNCITQGIRHSYRHRHTVMDGHGWGSLRVVHSVETNTSRHLRLQARITVSNPETSELIEENNPCLPAAAPQAPAK